MPDNNKIWVKVGHRMGYIVDNSIENDRTSGAVFQFFVTTNQTSEFEGYTPRTWLRNIERILTADEIELQCQM